MKNYRWLIWCMIGKLAYVLNKNKISSKIKNKFIDKKVVFFPYLSPDCISLHCSLKMLTNNMSSINRDRFDFLYYIKNIGTGLLHSDKLKYELQLRNLEFYYLPIIDEILRRKSKEYIPYNFEFSIKLFEALDNRIKYYESKLKDFEAVCLADSAYIENNIIRQVAKKFGLHVYYANPNGDFFEITKFNEYTVRDENLIQYSDINHQIKTYLDSRFLGIFTKNQDSCVVFSNIDIDHNIEKKKVLFLHAIRDANNIEQDGSSAFDTYYDWLDFTLNIIKKNQNKWFIKIHPQSKLYQDDLYFLESLFNKHKIDKLIYSNTPNTSTILNRRFPVYTNQGTIILETAIYGYQSYHCGRRYDDSIGKHSKTNFEWGRVLLNEVDDILASSEKQKKMASYFLYKNYGENILSSLSPAIGILPGDSRKKQYLKILSIIFKREK